MKRTLFMVVCGLCCANFAWSQEDGKSASLFEISIDSDVLAEKSDEDLLDMMEGCKLMGLSAECVCVGEVLLERNLASDQRLETLLALAKAYESIDEKWAGPQTRRSYQQILDEYPDAACADRVALRLGELYDHILRPGTTANSQKAQVYFKQIIDAYEKNVREDQKTDMVVLRAYIHLGNIYARRRNYDSANTCYAAIYHCDPDSVIDGDRESFRVLRAVKTLQEVAGKRLVHNCIRPDSQDSLAAFEQLEIDYADDLELLEYTFTVKQDYLERLEED